MTVIGKREGSPVTRIKSADPEGSSKVLRSALAALRLSLSAGEMIATAVGASSCEVGRPLCIAPGGPNYFVDFGVYDPRQLNEAAKADPSFLANGGPNSQKGIGLCWPELFPAWKSDLDRLAIGTSDFCRAG